MATATTATAKSKVSRPLAGTALVGAVIAAGLGVGSPATVDGL